LFETEGSTFTEYVRCQGRARAYQMLADSAYAGRTVSVIALEAGFGDVSYSISASGVATACAPPTRSRGWRENICDAAGLDREIPSEFAAP
jgi:AraC-like DNA-binding protein